MRRYAIHSAHNLRDLGGYPTQDGQYIGFGKLFRSDCPLELRSEDLAQLNTLGIGAIIDLRTSHECKSRPSPYQSLKGVSYHHIGFKTGDLAPASENEIPKGYLAMMEDSSTLIEALSVIVNTGDNTLFHCAVGKDRTGILAAIILMLCKVPMVDILADYQVSHTYLKPLIDDYKIKNPAMPEWVGMSKEAYLVETFSLLEHKYGSFDGYCEAVGIDHMMVETLQQKLCF